MHRIQIKSKPDSENIIENPRIYIDEKEIPLNMILGAKYSIRPDSVACLELELFGIPDIDAYGYVVITPTPTNINESFKIIREELLKRGDLYRAFSASIYSALKDISHETSIDEMPEIILDRIIGEEI